MVASDTARKRHLALDTDWMSATAAIFAFLAFGLLGAGMAWRMFQGKITVASVTLWTPVLAAGLIYLGIIESRDTVYRVAVLIYSLGPVSRTILWLGRASYQTRLTNEVFVRCIDIGLFFGVCIYAIYWLKTKVRHVESSVSLEARS